MVRNDERKETKKSSKFERNHQTALMHSNAPTIFLLLQFPALRTPIEKRRQ